MEEEENENFGLFIFLFIKDIVFSSSRFKLWNFTLLWIVIVTSSAWDAKSQLRAWSMKTKG